jgi:hypothetical protein
MMVGTAGGTADDSIGATVFTPENSEIRVVETSPTTEASGFTMLGRQISIEAPPATPDDPIIITFLIDRRAIPIEGERDSVIVLRNGVPVPLCFLGQSAASPDPCVSARVFVTGDDLAITVRTSEASEWNLSVDDQLVVGKKLVLRGRPAKPTRQRVTLIAKDRTLTLGEGPGSLDDPTIRGGSLRIVSGRDGGFDATYELDAMQWSPLKRKDPFKGWKYSRGTPIKKILLRAGKLLKIVGKGSELEQSLEADPSPVDVVLIVGNQRYCARFDETKKFKRGKQYVALTSGAPQACQPNLATAVGSAVGRALSH